MSSPTTSAASSCTSLTAASERYAGIAGVGRRPGRIWDVDSRREIATFAGHEDVVLDVTFSPDGPVMATAGWDNTVRLWDVEDKVQIVASGDTASWSRRLTDEERRQYLHDMCAAAS